MYFRVLHIEDSTEQRAIVKLLLDKRLGTHEYVYANCETVEEAESVLKKEFFDVILLDLSLPDSQGVATVLRVLTVSPGIPIVVLTASEDVDTAKAVIRSGASSYLRKSDMAALPLVLILTVEKWRMEQALANRCVLYDSIVNLSPDYICRFNTDYVITFANYAFCSLVGRPIGDVIGTRICDYLPDSLHTKFEDCAHLTENFCLLTEEGEFEINGHWVSWRANAIRNHTGAVIEIQCVGRDTTNAHRQTQELLKIARSGMFAQQQTLNKTVDSAFLTLLETNEMLSQMEKRKGYANG